MNALKWIWTINQLLFSTVVSGFVAYHLATFAALTADSWGLPALIGSLAMIASGIVGFFCMFVGIEEFYKLVATLSDTSQAVDDSPDRFYDQDNNIG